MNHDNYDKEILKQLKRIANSLELIAKKDMITPNKEGYDGVLETVSQKDELHGDA